MYIKFYPRQKDCKSLQNIDIGIRQSVQNINVGTIASFFVNIVYILQYLSAKLLSCVCTICVIAVSFLYLQN